MTDSQQHRVLALGLFVLLCLYLPDGYFVKAGAFVASIVVWILVSAAVATGLLAGVSLLLSIIEEKIGG